MSTTWASKILLDPVADQVIHRLGVEVLREASLNVVDERQLGVPLPRLFEQAGVLERNAQAPGERREQSDVGLTECTFAVQVLERDPARRLTADHERDVHRGQGRFTLDEPTAELSDALGEPLVDQ